MKIADTTQGKLPKKDTKLAEMITPKKDNSVGDLQSILQQDYDNQVKRIENLMANVDDPEDSIARIQMTSFLSERMDYSPEYIYKNLDTIATKYLGYQEDLKIVNVWEGMSNAKKAGERMVYEGTALGGQVKNEFWNTGQISEETFQKIDEYHSKEPDPKVAAGWLGKNVLIPGAQLVPYMGDITMHRAMGAATGAAAGAVLTGAMSTLGPTGTAVGAVKAGLLTAAMGKAAGYERGREIITNNLILDLMTAKNENDERLDSRITILGATVIGAISASVEAIQVSQLIPGSSGIITKALTKVLAKDSVKNILLRGASQMATRGAVETGEEVLQKITEDVGTKILKEIDNASNGKEWETIEAKDIIKNALNEAKETGPVMMALAGLSSGIGTGMEAAEFKQADKVNKDYFETKTYFEPTEKSKSIRPDQIVNETTEFDKQSTLESVDQAYKGKKKLPPVKVVEVGQKNGEPVYRTVAGEGITQVLNEKGVRLLEAEVVDAKDYRTEITAENQPQAQQSLQRLASDIALDYESVYVDPENMSIVIDESFKTPRIDGQKMFGYSDYTEVSSRYGFKGVEIDADVNGQISPVTVETRNQYLFRDAGYGKELETAIEALRDEADLKESTELNTQIRKLTEETRRVYKSIDTSDDVGAVEIVNRAKKNIAPLVDQAQNLAETEAAVNALNALNESMQKDVSTVNFENMSVKPGEAADIDTDVPDWEKTSEEYIQSKQQQDAQREEQETVHKSQQSEKIRERIKNESVRDKDEVRHNRAINKAKELDSKYNTKTNVVYTVAEFPAAVQNSVAEEGIDPRSVNGVYYNGVVYIASQNTQNVEKTWAHEWVAHRGMRALYGEEFTVQMEDLFETIGEKEINRVLGSQYDSFDNAVKAEEYIAAQAERLQQSGMVEKPSFWKKVLNAIRELLRKVHSVKFSDSEIQNLLYRSSQALKKPITSSYTTFDGTNFQVKAFHGSPYSFDKFSMGNIGTGEGAQAFGWGLYFTDVEDVARHYAKALAKPNEPKVTQNGRELTRMEILVHSEKAADAEIEKMIAEDPDLDAETLAQELERDLYEWLEGGDSIPDWFEAYLSEEGIEVAQDRKTRNLYKTTLHKGKAPSEYTWLEWNTAVPANIAKQIIKEIDSEGIQLDEKKGTRNLREGLLGISDEEFRKYLEDLGYNLDEYSQDTINNQKEDYVADKLYRDGGHFYRDLAHMLGSDREASMLLLRAGIDGIRYPAQSMGGGDGTKGYNYVVFDENAVTIEDQILFQLAPPTDSKAFRDWFGDSKVVNENGDPLVVYHGTRQEIESFGETGRKTHEFVPEDIYHFTDDYDEAEFYTEEISPDGDTRPGDTPSVYKVYLSIENPMVIESGKENPTNYYDQKIEYIIGDAQENNHDGVIVKGNGPSVYVAFSPTQIKSVNNQGTWDPGNPDIRYSLRNDIHEDIINGNIDILFSIKESQTNVIKGFLQERYGTNDVKSYFDAIKKYESSNARAHIKAKSPVASNQKTIMSVDVSTDCPMRQMGTPCPYCYVEVPRTKKAMGKKLMQSPKKVHQLIELEDQILNMPDDFVQFLNSIGGLRMFASGDYTVEQHDIIQKVLDQAKQKGLMIKAITKQIEFIDTFGHHPNLFINISSDFYPEHADEIAAGRDRKMEPEKRLKLRETIKSASREIGKGFLQDQVEKIKAEYPNVRSRYVAVNERDAIKAVMNPSIDVVTIYHGDTDPTLLKEIWKIQNQSMFEILGDDTVTELSQVFKATKALTIVNEDQKSLDEIFDGEVDVEEYRKQAWKKMCCVTGICSTCSVKCGFSDDIRYSLSPEEGTAKQMASERYPVPKKILEKYKNEAWAKEELERQNFLDEHRDLIDEAKGFTTLKDFKEYLDAMYFELNITEKQVVDIYHSSINDIEYKSHHEAMRDFIKDIKSGDIVGSIFAFVQKTWLLERKNNFGQVGVLAHQATEEAEDKAKEIILKQPEYYRNLAAAMDEELTRQIQYEDYLRELGFEEPLKLNERVSDEDRYLLAEDIKNKKLKDMIINGDVNFNEIDKMLERQRVDKAKYKNEIEQLREWKHYAQKRIDDFRDVYKDYLSKGKRDRAQIEIYKKEHENNVKKALERNLPVPDKVLEEFGYRKDWSVDELIKRSTVRRYPWIIDLAKNIDSPEELQKKVRKEVGDTYEGDTEKVPEKLDFYQTAIDIANRTSMAPRELAEQILDRIQSNEGARTFLERISEDRTNFHGVGMPRQIWGLVRKHEMQQITENDLDNLRSVANRNQIRTARAWAYGTNDESAIRIFESYTAEGRADTEIPYEDRTVAAELANDPKLKERILKGEINYTELRDYERSLTDDIKDFQKRINVYQRRVDKLKDDKYYNSKEINDLRKEIRNLEKEINKQEKQKRTQDKDAALDIAELKKKLKDTREVYKEKLKNKTIETQEKIKTALEEQRQKEKDRNAARKERERSKQLIERMGRRVPPATTEYTIGKKLSSLVDNFIPRATQVQKPLKTDELINLREKIDDLEVEIIKHKGTEKATELRKELKQTKETFQEKQYQESRVKDLFELLDKFDDYDVSEWKKAVEQFEGLALDEFENLAEVDKLYRKLEILRAKGRALRSKQLEDRKTRRLMASADMVEEVLQGDDMDPFTALGTQGAKRSNKSGFGTNVYAATLRPPRMVRYLGGNKEGMLYDWFVSRINEATNIQERAYINRKKAADKKMKELDITYRDLHKVVDVDPSIEKGLTVDEMIHIVMGMFNERNRNAILYGNNISPAIVEKVEGMLDDKYLEWGKWIMEEFDEHYDRLNQAFIEDKNMDMGDEQFYIPMKRIKQDNIPVGNEFADQLAIRQAWKRAYPAKGFTKERVDIDPENQVPIRLGITNIHDEHIRKQEHYIASQEVVKDLQYILQQKNFRNALRTKYGNHSVRWLDKYLNDYAQPNLYRVYNQVTSKSRIMRNNVAMGYLAYNILTVAKQAPSLAFYLKSAGPHKILASAAEFMANPKKMIDFVNERDPQMEMRVYNRIMEELKQDVASPALRSVRALGRTGMQPIMWMDKMVTTIGWHAVYKNKMKDLPEVEAIRLAQQTTLETQPAARAKDVAEIYRSDEGLNWFLMFSNQLNQIWNMWMYDLPQSLKKHEYMKALGMFTGLAVSGVTISYLGGWRMPEEPEELPKEVIGEMFKNYLASIPFVGSAIRQSYDGWYYGGLEPIPAVDAFGRVLKDMTTQDWENLIHDLGRFAKDASISLGAPTTGADRIYKAVKNADILELLGPGFMPDE